MESQPFISVIIPVYDDNDRLKIALGALEAQTYPTDSYEVIVVDNASPISPETIIAQYPHTRLVHETQRGSYVARNRGLEAAQGDYVAFTDADCIPNANWLENGVYHLQTITECGLVGGPINVYAQDPQAPTTAELFEMLFAFPVRTYMDAMHFAPTANMFTTRATFERVGLFDGNLQSNGDHEWGQRAYAHGCQQIYAEDVVVRHPARPTIDELLHKQQRVIGGQSQRLRAYGSVWQIIRQPVFWTSIPPPVPRIFRVLRQNQWTWKQRGAVISLLLHMYRIRLRERWRVLVER